ncbi:MAG: ethanolamine ammonia-lyase reactivating factor EutA [bacterium]|nr:ethanolamine ammonia-lyase reactivating factor EutA [bacterium]
MLFRKNKKSSDNSSKSNEKYIVGLDIGTEFVKALIAKVKGDTAEIIGVGRSHQNLGDMEAGAVADIAGVVANCDKALSQAEQQAGVSARTVIVGIAGELVKGTTNTVKAVRSNPDKEMDVDEVQRIIKLVQEKSEEKAKQQLAWEMGGKQVDIRLVNSALVEIEIDGYKVTNPVGFKGRDVVVQLYTAYAPLIHIGALERVTQELDLDLLAVAAEPFAVSRSVIGDDGGTMSAILMDVGGGTTDIAVLNDGGVQGTKMFGIGGRAYTRSIEREMGVSYDKAESLKLAVDGEPDKQKEEVKEALGKTIDVWIKGVELALSEFDLVDHLPNKMLLCGGGSSLELLVHELNATDWYKELPFTKKPIVQHIEPNEVVGIIDKTDSVTDHTFITALGLVRVGLDTLTQDSTSGSIKEKFNRILNT